MRPRVDLAVQAVAGAVGGAHVTVAFQGVVGSDVSIGQPTGDEVLDRLQGGLVGQAVVEVTDHTDG